MIEGSGAPGAGDGPVQPGVDDEGVASGIDAIHPERAAERIRFHGCVPSGDVSRVRDSRLRHKNLSFANCDLFLPGEADGNAPVLYGTVPVPGGAGTGTFPEGALGTVQEFDSCEGL